MVRRKTVVGGVGDQGLGVLGDEWPRIIVELARDSRYNKRYDSGYHNSADELCFAAAGCL